MPRSVSWWPALTLCAVVGCGSDRHPVEGTVIVKDSGPLTEGRIDFIPWDPQKNEVDRTRTMSATGNIQSDGSFRMGTEQEGNGVPEGVYRVTVVPASPPNPERPPKGWPPFHAKYKSPRESPLEITVERKRNRLDLQLDR